MKRIIIILIIIIFPLKVGAISASSYIVMDTDNNRVLEGNNINKQSLIASITKNECDNIISSSKEILTNAIIDGGTTIKSYTSSLGVTGHYQDKLYVHKRDNMNCKICNSLILKDRIGGRSTYYCPNCQK